MRFKPSLLGLSFVALALVAASACSDQAEGERCAKENDTADGSNTDCEAGLICKRLSQLGRTGTAAVCCPPPNGAPPTSEICLGQSGEVPADGGPNGRVDAHVSTPPDTGAAPAPVPEASVPTDATPAAHD